MHVHALYRYPVKGMTPEPLDGTVLAPGETVPGDRAFAVENGPSGFDPAAPAWQPKTKFLCWMKNPKLARVDARYDPAARVLALSAEGFGAAAGDPAEAAGRSALEAWLAGFMAEEQEGPLRLLAAPGHSFSDSGAKVVSLINLSSLADLAEGRDLALEPLRFRANLYMEGVAPWAEAGWIGHTLAVGTARLKVVRPIRRCLATHVNPARGVRDVDTLGLLRARRNDLYCGVYAEVTAPGEVRPGAAVSVVD
jgi:uncharacterized protein YcbX